MTLWGWIKRVHVDSRTQHTKKRRRRKRKLSKWGATAARMFLPVLLEIAQLSAANAGVLHEANYGEASRLARLRCGQKRTPRS